MGEAAGAWTAVVGAAFALLNWLYSSSRIEDECVKEDAHIPVGDAELTDEELQAYVNIAWAILDLRRAEGGAEEDNIKWKPNLEQSIYQAIEGVEDENLVPELESRLLTMFNLVRPREVEYEYAQDVYISQHEPAEGTIVRITLSMAFAVSAGFCIIHDMKWPDMEWSERYEVLENPECDELYLSVCLPKPKSEKNKGAAAPRRPPRGAPSTFIYDVLYGIKLRKKCRIYSMFGMVEFSYEDGQLNKWDGIYPAWAGQYITGVTVGISPVIGIRFDRPTRDLTSSVFEATANDIEHYSAYKKFWRWFHTIALRGYIKGAFDNSKRNSWFSWKAENELEGGVYLNEPVQVRTLKRFLGGAFWANSKETRMAFTGVFNAKLLVGYIHPKGNYLKLKWVSDNGHNKKRWGFNSKRKVDGDQIVGYY